jgi:hypothetical protein
MNDLTTFGAYFKNEYQEIIIKGFNLFCEPIKAIYENYCSVNEIKEEPKRIQQLIYLIVIQKLFGLNRSQIITLFSSNDADKIKKYILKLRNPIPSRGWLYPLLKDIFKTHYNSFSELLHDFLDYYYITIGENERKRYKKIFKETKRKITPIGAFFGIPIPSQIYPINVFKRAELMPYYNSRMYLHINRISSTKEFVGKIKEIDYENGKHRYRLAGDLGFIMGAPGKQKFYIDFAQMESMVESMEKNVDSLLTKIENY